MPITENELSDVAGRILSAAETRTQIPPVTGSLPGFGLAEAYRVSLANRDRRIARGDRLAGWKIGLTNRSVWPSLGIVAPIWGPMYGSTVSAVNPGDSIRVSDLVSPKIEPEIGFRLARVPDATMDEDTLLACIDAVMHGFEIVDCIYPEWKFKAPDGIASGGLHARYVHGPLVKVEPAERARWSRMLEELSITIFRDGIEMDRGRGTAVLDSPLKALRHLVANMATFPGYVLRPGDLITTGTITTAFPVSAGERWSTKVEGIPLPGMDLLLT